MSFSDKKARLSSDDFCFWPVFFHGDKETSSQGRGVFPFKLEKGRAEGERAELSLTKVAIQSPITFLWLQLSVPLLLVPPLHSAVRSCLLLLLLMNPFGHYGITFHFYYVLHLLANATSTVY